MTTLIIPAAVRIAFAQPLTEGLNEYLNALRGRHSEAEVCALVIPALEELDALVDEGYSERTIVKLLGPKLDARSAASLRARLVETLAACHDAD